MKNRAVIISLAAVLLFSACGNKQENEQVLLIEAEALETEQTVTVERGEVENYVLLQGYVAPKVHQMNFEETGTFGEYKVELGEEVTRGQVLAVMDDAQIKQEIEDLKSRLSDLTAEYEYNTAYIDKTIAAYEEEMKGYYAKLEDKRSPLSAEEYSAVCRELGIRDVAKQREELKKTQLSENYEFESAYLQRRLKEKTETLGRMEIKAPCDGVVIELLSPDVKYSRYVQPENYYVAIAEKDVYCVRCEYMAPTYLESLEKICGFRNGKEYALVGMEMDEKEYRARKNAGETLYTKFEISSPDEEIEYGDLMMVKLVVSSRKNVLVIPNITIDGDEAGKYVHRQTEEGKEKVYISIGISDTIITEVQSGLEEGEVVYVQK